MTEKLPHVNKLSKLDYAFSLMDSAESPQDFVIILHLSNPPSLEKLRTGARSATYRYPVSGSTIKNREWVYDTNQPLALSSNGHSLDSFVNQRFDSRREAPVKQILVANGADETCLVTRFHHTAADGLSAALWLGHQLGVAYELVKPETARAPFAELPLRNSTTSVRRSVFAYNGASDPLWTTNYIPSGARQWLTTNFDAAELVRACRKARGFSYSDLLATCVLELFANWNQKHEPKATPKIGLWYPVNIRAKSPPGFGNGTSRIRLYAKYRPDAPFADKARTVRKQVSWSTNHGEWVIPQLPLFTRLPRPIVAPLLNGYLKQPTVDMATGVFSHADRWAGDAAESFKHVTRIECVGLLHSRQRLAINAATHHERTWMTFTYDPALLNASDARELVEKYEQQIAAARKELV